MLRSLRLVFVVLLSRFLGVQSGSAALEKYVADAYVDAGLISSKTIRLQRASIHYLTAGPSHTNAASRVLLFCHGAAFTARTWQYIGALDAAAKNGFSVVAPDLPGYGQSEKLPGIMSKEEFLPAFAELIQIKGRIVVIAASMGGSFALPLVLNPGAFRIDGYIAIAGNIAPYIAMARSNIKTLIIFGENDDRRKYDSAQYKRMFQFSDEIIVADAPHPAYLRDVEAAYLVTDYILVFCGVRPRNVKFLVGTRVTCYRDKMGNRFPADDYDGVISRVYPDYTYDIDFDDGNKRKRVGPGELTRLIKPVYTQPVEYIATWGGPYQSGNSQTHGNSNNYRQFALDSSTYLSNTGVSPASAEG